MKSSLYIITGGSNGFGKSLVQELLLQKQSVISISRSRLTKEKVHSQLIIDFSKPFEKKVQSFFKKISLKKVESVILINNAGMVDPIDRIENLKEAEVLKQLKVNLLAPIIMSKIVLKTFRQQKKLVVQITSGAATRAVEGWSVYCASKAGLDMFNQVLAADCKAIGYSPGIMDTAMQTRIRQSSKKQFPAVEDFKRYKKEKALRSTEDVAKDLLDLIKKPEELIAGQVYRVRL